MSTNLSVGFIGAGPGGLALGMLLARAGFCDVTIFDLGYGVGGWTTQCSNYFRAANGRAVTQWPRSARSFWTMTRRFKPADFSFSGLPAQAAPAVSARRSR
jgi:phytoene dehydrogenase-like protein